MLTADLLVTRTHKGSIEPVYALLDHENLEIAASVIGVFRGHIGRTYGDLLGELEGLEEMDYRLIRGLSQILERRCIIDKDSVVDPIVARRAVFEESGGLAASGGGRKEVLNRVAGRLSIGPDDLEKALWADLEENLVVKDFGAISPEDLIRQYNLSLAQTLLFKATGMEVQMEDNYQPAFWKMKQLGLMYSIEDDKIFLDGPLSVFKMTDRYGTALAKLLPIVTQSRKWRLKAGILKKTPQGKKIYDFTLDQEKRHLFGIEPEIEKKPGFDSAVEKELYQLGFNGWTVRREPTVLKAGAYAFIPDFSMERNGTKIYVEIIGFWTPEYLRNKINKINKLKDKENLILLVNRSLACSGKEFQVDNLIFYDKKIPHLEIIKVLRRYEEKQRMDEVARLGSIKISIDDNKDVASLEDIAQEYGVSLEAIREVVKGQSKNQGKDQSIDQSNGQSKSDHLLLGDQLVSNRTLERIRGELNGVKKYNDALDILERHGIKARSQALESLGYKVRWTGLDAENAEILER